jgi:hypothetical protein
MIPKPQSKAASAVQWWGLVCPTWSLGMTQILVLTVALLLFGGGVWANVDGNSLSQSRGAWVSHAIR